METLQVRQARAQLARLLKATTPTLIGDKFHTRALIIPIGSTSDWLHPPLQKRLRLAQRAANQAFRQLRRDTRR